ncbi:MAG: O-antigen ligase family protein [Bacillus sp. (in: firmicutes)]
MREIKINKKDFLLIMIFVPFLEPKMFQYISSIDTIFNILKVLSTIYISIQILNNINRISLFGYLWVFYTLSFFIPTIIYSGDLWKVIISLLPSMCFGVYLDILLRHNSKKCIKALFTIYTSYLIINSVLLLIFKNGLGMYISGYDYTQVDSRLNFLGLDNSFITAFLPITLLAAIWLGMNNKKFKTLVIIMSLNMIFVWSGTGIIGYTLVIILVFLKPEKLIKIKLATPSIIIYLILYSSIVIFRFQNYFSYLIVDVLGKDLTFTGRTILWDLALSKIPQKPLFGFGFTKYDLLVAPNGSAYSSHNTILQIFLLGGVLAFSILCIAMFITRNKLNKCREKNIANIISVFIFISWFSGMTENYSLEIQFYLMLFIAYHIDSIVKSARFAEMNKGKINGDLYGFS